MSKKHSRSKYPDGYLESWVKDTVPKKRSKKFVPVSGILSIQNNYLLSKDNGYKIKFNTGMLEGKGISIDETGIIITFSNEGSYRFELCGNGVVFSSDVEVKLIYESESFTDDIKMFTETDILKNENKLLIQGISTILPIRENQSITIKLQAIPDEKIILNAGTRLLIYRVA